MFKNRKDAGNTLGRALEKFKDDRPIVLGIPRGGVEVGFYVAEHLNSDFNTIVIRKLGYPTHPEAAFGSLAEDGSIYLDPWSDKFLNKEIIEEVLIKEKKEIDRRIQIYRGGKELPKLGGRPVILVDDGIATGATIFGAINMCRKYMPSKLIVAAPISGYGKLLVKLYKEADEVIIPEKRKHFRAVSQGYSEFPNLTDKEVLSFLEKWNNHKNNNKKHLAL